ncbi:hypothetical protein [Snodgrassella sp. CFCC 13594]|uniref:hypothetical protein n=1 Tax=Snodgrassella sp. CFCC 13594 TaxID=1775559 RepID=UPI0008298A14|nr:hypothetical protein [Snodgrassella sp. CFCC 13594]
MVFLGRRFPGTLLLVLMLSVGGCAALPPEQRAVSDIRKNQGKIVYQNDVAVKGNQTVAGFRTMPIRPEAPEVTERIAKPALAVSQCIQAKLQSRFKLPPEFFTVTAYANNGQTVALVNPFTKTQGLQMDIIETGVSTAEIKLYDNGTTLSRAWKQFPASCK